MKSTDGRSGIHFSQRSGLEILITFISQSDPRSCVHTYVPFKLIRVVRESFIPLMPIPSLCCKPRAQTLRLTNAITVGYCLKQNGFVHHGNPLFKSTGKICAPHAVSLGRGVKEELDQTPRREEERVIKLYSTATVTLTSLKFNEDKLFTFLYVFFSCTVHTQDFKLQIKTVFNLCLLGSPLHYHHHHHHPASLLPHHQHYHLPYSHFPFPYPGSPGSPKPANHPPLTRVASNPTFPSVSSPAPGSPSPLNETPSPGSNDSVTMSPPVAQHPNMWPPHTQPLFSLANVISMAMSMAQSFIPPASMPTQGMPSFPGFHPQLPASIAPQSGYPSVYPQHYQTTPVEVHYPTAGIPTQNIYHRPETMPQMESFSQSNHPSWLHPVSPLSMASTPPPVPQEPLQQFGFPSPPSLTQEDIIHSYVPPYAAQVPAQAEPRSEVSSSNSLSDLSPSPPESPESTVSHLQSLFSQFRFPLHAN